MFRLVIWAKGEGGTVQETKSHGQMCRELCGKVQAAKLGKILETRGKPCRLRSFGKYNANATSSWVNVQRCKLAM
jgi:hypothetical protein